MLITTCRQTEARGKVGPFHRETHFRACISERIVEQVLHAPTLELLKASREVRSIPQEPVQHMDLLD